MGTENISELLDQKVAVRISEPKSFGAEHSTGPFPGVITAIRDNTVVIALDTDVVFRGEKIIQLVASPRYERDHLNVPSLDEGVAVTLLPVTQLDMAEFGDDYTVAAARRTWFLAGDLMLAGHHAPRLTETVPPQFRP
jgi:hypothetical protein